MQRPPALLLIRVSFNKPLAFMLIRVSLTLGHEPIVIRVWGLVGPPSPAPSAFMLALTLPGSYQVKLVLPWHLMCPLLLILL